MGQMNYKNDTRGEHTYTNKFCIIHLGGNANANAHEQLPQLYVKTKSKSIRNN